MFELLISDKHEADISLGILAKRLKTETALVKGVFVYDIYQGRERICLAVPEKAADYFVARVKEEIIEHIAVEYKYRYFLQNLQLPLSDDFLKTAFLSSLAVFDKETDKKYIRGNLVLGGEINIDSAFLFRLPLLVERWQEISKLVMDNIVDLSGREGLLEMMKFLIASCPCESEEVVVTHENDALAIKNARGETQFVVAQNEANKLVHLLVLLLPKRLVVEDNNLTRLKEVFDTRVEICK